MSRAHSLKNHENLLMGTTLSEDYNNFEGPDGNHSGPTSPKVTAFIKIYLPFVDMCGKKVYFHSTSLND